MAVKRYERNRRSSKTIHGRSRSVTRPREEGSRPMDIYETEVSGPSLLTTSSLYFFICKLR